MSIAALQNYLDSFKNGDSGWSRKKCMGFFSMVTAAVISYQHATDTNFFPILVAWLLFAGLCIGLIVFADIIKFKNGGGTYPQPTTDLTDKTNG